MFLTWLPRHGGIDKNASLSQLVEQYQALEAEADQYRQNHEQYAAVVDEWSKKVEELEEALRVADTEKTDANSVAYQWQSEALHFEREVAAREETAMQAQQQLAQCHAKLQEAETELAQAKTQAQAQAYALSQAQALNQSSSTAPGTPGPSNERASRPRQDGGGTVDNDDNIFDDGFMSPGAGDGADSFSAMKSPHSVASGASTAVSSSVAKRILLTWDKTMVERNKAKVAQRLQIAKAKQGRSVSHSTFLITVSGRAPFFSLLSQHCLSSLQFIRLSYPARVFSNYGVGAAVVLVLFLLQGGRG